MTLYQHICFAQNGLKIKKVSRRQTMMTMNRPYKMVMIIAGIVAVMALAVGITNELKRRTLINYNKQIVASLSAEIDAYKGLGFAESDKVIEVTKARLTHAQEQLESLKNNRQVIFKGDALKTARKERLENLLQVNREMANNYRQEIQEYTSLGMPERHSSMRVAKDNLVRLVVEIAELENRLQSFDAENKEDGIAQKVNSLISLHKQSLDLYKNELQEYTKLGLGEKDAKVKFVRGQITNKASEIEVLERHLR